MTDIDTALARLRVIAALPRNATVTPGEAAVIVETWDTAAPVSRAELGVANQAVADALAKLIVVASDTTKTKQQYVAAKRGLGPLGRVDLPPDA